MAKRALWRRQLPAFIAFLFGAEPLRELLTRGGNGAPATRSALGLSIQASVFLAVAVWLYVRAWRESSAPTAP
jgi:hypothetical protein